MKKYLGIFITVLLAISVFCLCVCATETTVYVKDGGTGDGSSASSPVGTFLNAVAKLSGNGGKIVLCGDTTVSSKTTLPEQAGDLIITSENGAKLLIKHRLQLEKNTNTNIITFDLPFDVTADFNCYMFGGYNNVVFTENCVMTNSGGGGLRFFGGINASEAETIDDCIAELPYSITVKNGVFNQFEGGNYRGNGTDFVGTVAAPISINISGGTFGVEGDYSAALSPLKNFSAFTIGGMNILASDVDLTVSGGTFNTPIYISGRIGTIHSPAQSNSKKIATDKAYYAQDGDVTITISGGTFNGGAVCDTYVDAGYARLMRGNYTVTVTGGTFKEGTVFDATQVKPYAGEDKKATITYAENLGISAKRFDVENGVENKYNEPLRYAFIGDSITEGHSSGSPMTLSYPAQFLSLELEAGNDVIVSNLGVSGSGMLPSTSYYYPEMLPAPLALGEVDADIYFFAIGTNDAFTAGNSTGTAQHFYDEYTSFIGKCAALPDTDEIYISSALFRARGAGPYSMRAAAVMRPLQKRIAEELISTDAQKYHYVDLYALTYDDATAGTLFTSDELHPHADGYGIMAKDVYNAIHNDVFGVENFEMSDVYVEAGAAEYGAGTSTDPASSLSIALSKCAPDATVHITGTLDWDTTVAIPEGLGTVTLKGESEDAAINFTAAATFRIGSDLVVDNLKISAADGKYVTIFGDYHNVTFTESFTSSGNVQFYAGYRVNEDAKQIDVYEKSSYDTEGSASSDADCTVNILSGTFTTLCAGNRRFAALSPFGTYSGDMIFNVGDNVTVTDVTNSGIVGMNYLAGSVTAYIGAWGSIALKENTRLASMSGDITYDRYKNTGNVVINIASGAAVDAVYTCDINADDKVDIADVLGIVRYVLDGIGENDKINFYEVEEFSLRDAIFILKKLAA